jgi:hypothetical protein
LKKNPISYTGSITHKERLYLKTSKTTNMTKPKCPPGSGEILIREIMKSLNNLGGIMKTVINDCKYNPEGRG